MLDLHASGLPVGCLTKGDTMKIQIFSVILAVTVLLVSGAASARVVTGTGVDGDQFEARQKCYTSAKMNATTECQKLDLGTAVVEFEPIHCDSTYHSNGYNEKCDYNYVCTEDEE